MRRRGAGPVAVLVLAAALALTACGVRPEGQARALGPGAGPAGVLVTPSAAPATGARAEQLAFVRDARLSTVSRPATEVNPGKVLRDLLDGPLPAERGQGLSTALPAASGSLEGVRDGVASVDLNGALLDNGRSDQVLALAQVVLSLDALPDVTGVRFLRDGEPLPVPRADGAIVTGPVTAADYRDLLGP